MNKCLSILTAALVLLISQQALCGTYGGGLGTAAEPYIISTADHIEEMRVNSGDWNKYFIMTADIDLAGRTYSTAVIAPDTDNSTYGTNYQGIPFAGVFDGDSHVISNLTINTSTAGNDYLGLFGVVSGTSAEIKNLSMEDVNVSGGILGSSSNRSEHVGGLIGADSKNSVTNCYVSGDVSGHDFVGGMIGRSHDASITDSSFDGNVNGYARIGGLIGKSSSSITNCNIIGNISSDGSVGGLVGSNEGYILNCYANGNFNGGRSAGGLVGGNSRDGTISNCYAIGNVSADGAGGLVAGNSGTITNSYAIAVVTGIDSPGGLEGSAGGLVASAGGTILNCYANSSVTGTDNVGGLVGIAEATIKNCYAFGSAIGYRHVGGLVGLNEKNITNCYAAGRVSGSISVGGLVGKNNDGSYSSCFWDNEVNSDFTGVGETEDPVGVIGRTTLQMYMQGTYINEGWDFVGETANGTEDYWYMSECGYYPSLSWQEVEIVPDVTGLLQTDAEDLLDLASVTIDVKVAHSEIVPIGYVISQNPPAGCEAAMVRITVSDGYPYETGSGTESDPYQIWTPEQMNAIGVHTNDWGKHFVLMNDIDMSAYIETSYNVIGNDRGAFLGTFKGEDHTISNLTYISSGKNYIGLFGFVGSGGEITGLRLVGVNIDAGYGKFIGGIAGYNYYSTITNCYSAGNVSGGEYVGGLTGHGSETTISNCYSVGNISGGSYLGGLAGNIYESDITNCYSSSRISGYNSYAGGLVGKSRYSTISNCFASCDISGGVHVVGGLMGYNYHGDITNCYARGIVSGGDSTVGGLVGWNDYDGTIENCYAIVAVSDGSLSRMGGLVGENREGIYKNSFWNSDLNPDLTGIGSLADPASVMARSTLDMQTQSAFTDYRWDFVGESENGTDDFWFLPECGYPALSWQSIGIVPDLSGLSRTQAEELVTSAGPVVEFRLINSEVVPEDYVVSQDPAAGCEAAIVTVYVSVGHPYYGGGLGTIGDPFQIWTAEQLKAVGEHSKDWNKYFVLMADIDMDVYRWASIQTIGDEITPFSGVFDGNGYTVKNLTIRVGSDKNCIGMFGVISGPKAKVYNLGIENVIIVDGDESWYVGGLVGVNEGVVINCHVSGGSVYGSWSVGGLGGFNEGTIEDCYSDCEVGGDDFVGGLVGSDINGSIINCYSVSTVNGLFAVGGLSGENYESSISRCFAEGTVTGELFVGGFSGLNESTIINCYAVGAVNGIASIGGLFGRNYGIVTNCYSVGTVVGDVSVGGLTGGEYNGRYTSCFWDGDVNPGLMGVGNIDDPTGVMGRSTGLMQTANMYIYAGWDFAGEEINGTEDIWRLCVDEVSYPRLRWEHDSVGDFECPDGTAGEDLEYFVEHWLTSDGRADLNGDGVVTLFDFALFAEHWMEGV